mmetsp:Transcript_16461/g.31220  ORF Transcript_16461/g.31220 Transcript_16461/m.31220 type:complete len:320 (-) Transcript_16461:127-1086(-)
MCCCCCGSKAAHIATLLLLGFTYICIFIGFAGSSKSESPWGTARIKLEYGAGSDQTQEMDFFLKEYTIDRNCGSDGQPCPLNESATIKYSDSECKQDFCDKCDEAGDGIITCLVLAFLVGLPGGFFVWKRLEAANSVDGEPLGCSKMRIYASCTLSIMALFLYIAFQVWFNPCQSKIDDYTNALKDEWGQPSTVDASASSGSSVATGFVLTGLIVMIVAAGNQCCAVPTSRRRPEEGVVGVDVPPGGIALAQPVVPPPGGQYPAQAYPSQPYPAQPYAQQPHVGQQGQPVYAAEAVLVNNQMAEAKGFDQPTKGGISTV